MDLNKVMIIGRLTRDPESKSLTNGANVATFAVATNFVWKDESGQRKDRPEYHNIVAWRKLADICSAYLKKGSKVYVEGRLQTRSWTDQNGMTRYRTEIVADNIILLDNKGSGTPVAPTLNASSAPTGVQNQHDEEIKIEDIPFA